MPTKKKKPHWTQTDEGKIKLKTMKKKDTGLGSMPEKIEQNQCMQATTSTMNQPNQFVDALQPIDTRWRLEKFLQEFFAKGVNLATRKNNDYAGTGDPFYNLRRFGLQGIVVRMGDKLARLETLATHNYLAVTDEKYSDTLLDLANYAALAAAFLYQQQVEVASGSSTR